MTELHALIFGVIEGLTEFLPVSSTGHLILAAELLALPHSEFLKSFEIVIQLGAILAVLVLYWRRFFEKAILLRLGVAFLPTGIAGLLFYPLVKRLLGNPTVVILSMLLGGIALVLFERLHTERAGVREEVTSLTFRQAAFIGCAQAVSLVPGVSRSAASIVGGLAAGARRAAVVEFSFLLAVPTILAATLLDLTRNVAMWNSGEEALLVAGFVSAFVCALLAILLLRRFIRRHTFTPFGWYRIIVALIAWWVIR